MFKLIFQMWFNFQGIIVKFPISAFILQRTVYNSLYWFHSICTWTHCRLNCLETVPHTIHFFYICCGCWGNGFGLPSSFLAVFGSCMHSPFHQSSTVSLTCSHPQVQRWEETELEMCLTGVSFSHVIWQELGQQVNNQNMCMRRKQFYRLCENRFLKSPEVTGMYNKNFLCRKKRKSNGLCNMSRF